LTQIEESTRLEERTMGGEATFIARKIDASPNCTSRSM